MSETLSEPFVLQSREPSFRELDEKESTKLPAELCRVPEGFVPDTREQILGLGPLKCEGKQRQIRRDRYLLPGSCVKGPVELSFRTVLGSRIWWQRRSRHSDHNGAVRDEPPSPQGKDNPGHQGPLRTDAAARAGRPWRASRDGERASRSWSGGKQQS